MASEKTINQEGDGLLVLSGSTDLPPKVKATGQYGVTGASDWIRPNAASLRRDSTLQLGYTRARHIERCGRVYSRGRRGDAKRKLGDAVHALLVYRFIECCQRKGRDADGEQNLSPVQWLSHTPMHWMFRAGENSMLCLQWPRHGWLRRNLLNLHVLRW